MALGCLELHQNRKLSESVGRKSDTRLVQQQERAAALEWGNEEVVGKKVQMYQMEVAKVKREKQSLRRKSNDVSFKLSQVLVPLPRGL